MESMAEKVAGEGVSAVNYSRAISETLRSAIHPNVVGFKSVLAYRATLRIDYTMPSNQEVEIAAGKWLKKIEKTDQIRITDPILERHLI